MLMTFFNKVAEVLTENPDDFAQAVFSRTGRPQEAKYLFILMLLTDMLTEEMLLTPQGEKLVEAVTAAHKGEESNQSALMRFMCEDAEFAYTQIQPVFAAHIAANREILSEKSFWRDKTEETVAKFPDRDQLVRTACHIMYADTFKCSFNEAAERLGE